MKTLTDKELKHVLRNFTQARVANRTIAFDLQDVDSAANFHLDHAVVKPHDKILKLRSTEFDEDEWFRYDDVLAGEVEGHKLKVKNIHGEDRDITFLHQTPMLQPTLVITES